MLAIRLKRIGRRHQPAFRIVVAEKRSKRDGRSIDDLGFYNPITKNFGIKKERLDYWLGVGAKATPTVHNLFVRNKIISGSKIKIKIKNKRQNIDETKTQDQQNNNTIQ